MSGHQKLSMFQDFQLNLYLQDEVSPFYGRAAFKS